MTKEYEKMLTGSLPVLLADLVISLFENILLFFIMHFTLGTGSNAL